MKVVLDTNVLVSGLISAKGPCGQILQLTFGGVLQPCVDGRILDEYETVLPRPLFRIHAEDVAEALSVIRLRAERIAPMPLDAELPDKTDLPFIEVAAAAGAILVTGNLRHFPKRTCKGVTVVSPREFLDHLRQSPS